jgi:asparagine synthase (glutamine-hydrolysing)
VSEDVVRAMCAVIAHRGPDDEGFFFDNELGLGMRRLSIIDLEGGRQPISSEDGSLWVICNGEIYNYRELTAELKRKGHRFKTRSDTEVLLHAYEEWGIDFLHKLNGMFAFAIFDRKDRKLLLARDRLGIKPLFYAVTKNGVTFCSEIKGIIQDPRIAREMDPQSVFDYFSYGYVPGPRTAFKGINQLLPGHYLEVSGGGVRLHKYWDIKLDEDYSRDEAYFQEKILEHLTNAVERCLVSDVPVSLFLSSGIDSSALLALIKGRKNAGDFRTFSIGYNEQSYDEVPAARRTAQHFKTEHNELYCTPEHLSEIFDKLVWHCDNLLGDFGHILNFKMQEMASKKNKVALIGAGGDELFIGYITYQADKLLRVYQKLPKAIRERFIPLLVNNLPASYEKLSLDFKLKHFIERAGFEPAKAHYSWKTIFSDEEKTKLLLMNGQADPFDRFADHLEKVRGAETLNQYLYGDLKTWLPEQLYFTDAVSMASSVENRLPYLDHELVELAFSIPLSMRMRGLKLKHIFKKAVKPLLPKEVIRRKKLGAGAPFAKWIDGKLQGLVLNTLTSERVKRTGVLDPNYVHQLVSEHMLHRKNNAYKIWGLMTFVRWHELYFTDFKAVKL